MDNENKPLPKGGVYFKLGNAIGYLVETDQSINIYEVNQSSLQASREYQSIFEDIPLELYVIAGKCMAFAMSKKEETE